MDSGTWNGVSAADCFGSGDRGASPFYGGCASPTLPLPLVRTGESVGRLRRGGPRTAKGDAGYGLLNDLLRGRLTRFSLDALVGLAGRAGLVVRMKIGREAA
jgi:hypothetical protein